MKADDLKWIDFFDINHNLIGCSTVFGIKFVDTYKCIFPIRIFTDNQEFRLVILLNENKKTILCSSVEEAKSKAKEICDKILNGVNDYIANTFFNS